MALAYDSTGPNSTGNTATNTTSTSWSHTMGSVSNGLMMACLSYIGPVATDANVTAIDFNGDAFTSGPLARSTNSSFAGRHGTTEFYALTNPDSGAHTVSVTWDGAVYCQSGTVAYSGASGTGNTNTGTGNAADNGSPTVTTASGNIALDCVGVDYNTNTLVSTQTERWKGIFFGGAGTGYAEGSQDAAGVDPTMAWGWTATSQWTWSGIEITASGGGGATRPVKMAGQWGGFAGEAGGFA